VTDLHTDLKLHDARVQGNVAQVVAAQDRIADAVDKVAEATGAIRVLAEQWEKRNGRGFAIDRQKLMWLLVLLFVASGTAGGASQLVNLILAGLKP